MIEEMRKRIEAFGSREMGTHVVVDHLSKTDGLVIGNLATYVIDFHFKSKLGSAITYCIWIPKGDRLIFKGNWIDPGSYRWIDEDGEGIKFKD
jgi:hypothetical protein